MSVTKKSDAASGKKRWKPWQKNLIFALVVLAVAAALQVKDGAIAFLDSQCPDHICEQFGWLDKDGAWAACVPAGVYVVVQEAAS